MKLLIILATFLLPFSAYAEASLFTPEENKHIVVDNRILAKVNGKAISVVDVMKKMDMLFYRSFPEYTSITPARFQFYQMNWKKVLEELIDKELIVADAEEVKLPVSHGDVRQEMENLFGPNIISNLDKIGLHFDEAWKMVSSDIIIKKMVYIRGQAKAIKQITPQVVHDHYDKFAKDNIRPDTWVYTVITVRDPDESIGAEISHQAYKLLVGHKTSIQDFKEKLKEFVPLLDSTKVSVSDEIRHHDKEISDLYKSKVKNIQNNTFTQPFAQKSRGDNSTVFRILYLKEYIPGGAVPFQEVAKQLKDELIDEAASKETDLYLNRLRKHFDVQETHLDSDFEPFRLL